ncbi:MAG TPA: Lrp/AsnC ligand binding domain-containing protein [Candidatus Nitrosotalea sp.]|nr:Lrp/AsnC ligand binding domain-containing protein [Candidatus Nitrosotalea sp.]
MPSAYVLMRCEQGKENEIVQNLTRTGYIKEVQPTIGHYDLVAKLTFPSEDYLDEILEEIRINDKICSTKVLRTNETIESE